MPDVQTDVQEYSYRHTGNFLGAENFSGVSYECHYLVGTVTVHWENIHICEIEAAVIYNVENTMNMYLIRIQHKLLSDRPGRVSRNQVVDRHSSCTVVPYLCIPTK